MDSRKVSSPKPEDSTLQSRGRLLAFYPLFGHREKRPDHSEKPRDNVGCRIRTSFCILLLLAYASYATFFPSQLGSLYAPNIHLHSSSASLDLVSAISISHVLFSIGGSARTWESRRHYVELWWRQDRMRGHVWLDKAPPGGAKSWPPGCPPYKVSEDASRFGRRASATRIARIVKEAYLAALAAPAAPGAEELRWLVMGDDDTVFFTENLLAMLSRYDHRELHYIGGISESVEQDVFHSYAMAFGGGGFAVSLPAAAEISQILDRCLLRYVKYYGSDRRIQACMSELGVPLTRELGFHQMDIRGNPFGLLAAHPVAPLVSLHHLDYIEPIFPRSSNRSEALARLIAASHVDPARTLQQTICYDPAVNWSVSVSWGYAVQIFPYIVNPDELQTPFQTFQTWASRRGNPFTFNTRQVSSDPCLKPVVFFLDKARSSKMGKVGSLTEYVKEPVEREQKRCLQKEFAALEKVQGVQVISPIMDLNDWKSAPRRQCCKAKMAWLGGYMSVQIRKCGLGETISPP